HSVSTVAEQVVNLSFIRAFPVAGTVARKYLEPAALDRGNTLGPYPPPRPSPPPLPSLTDAAGGVLLAVSLLACGAPPATPVPPDAAPVEWPTIGGSPDGSHFAPLADITRENVRGLRVAWTHRTGDVSD